MDTQIRRVEPMSPVRVEQPWEQEAGTLRIVSWNLCMGGGNRIVGIVAALVAMNADVALLCEVNRARHGELARALAGAGLVYQADRLALVTGVDPYGQLVASRYPLESGDQAGPLGNPNRFIHVTMTTSAGPMDLVGIHVPVINPDASDFFDALCSVLANVGHRRGLVAGDVNADGRYPGLVTRFIPRMVKTGWVDALNEADHGGDHDSYWGRTTAYAIDRIWLSPALAGDLTSAAVLDRVDHTQLAGPGYRIKAGALSDHRPVTVDLNQVQAI